MGRRKIPIEPIKEDRNRTVTFMKRKAGLFKKAHELAVLCQVHLALVVLTPDGRVFEYSTSENAADVLEKRKAVDQVERSTPATFSGKTHDTNRQYDGAQGYEKSDSDYEENGPIDLKTSDAKKRKRGSGDPPRSKPAIVAPAERPISNKPRLKVQIPLAASQPESTKKPITPLAMLAGSVSSNQVGVNASPGQSTQSDQHPKTDADNKANGDGSGNGNGTVTNFSSPQFQQHYGNHPLLPQLVQFPFQQRLNGHRGEINTPNGIFQGFTPIGYQNIYSPSVSVGYGYSPHPQGPQANNVAQHSQAGQPSQAGQLSQMTPTTPRIAQGVAGYRLPSNQSLPKVNSNNGSVAIPGAGASYAGNNSSLVGNNSMMNSSGGSRWSAYPQSPMTYFMPAPVDQNGNRSEQGPMTAALSTRYMNDIMTSPTNYFSME